LFDLSAQGAAVTKAATAGEKSMKARRMTIKITLVCLAVALLSLPLCAQSGVAVVNAASFEPQFPVAPGAWATAFGDFASVGVSDTFATSVPFPAMLGGVQVFINNVASPMNFAGGGQINFLVPRETPTGRQPLRIAVSGMNTFEGTVQVFDVSPGLLSINPGDAAKPGAVLNQDGSVNSQGNPAARGEVISIYGVGADFEELPENGAEAPLDRLIPTTTETKVFVSVAEATLQFSGLAPGLVNAWQINAVVPDESFVSGLVPVYASLGNLRTNSVSIWVEE
jgi:uncharacterized protein (TIGR03437 family)